MILIEFKEDDLTMLRGVLACAGVRDVRYYLNGIHISDRYVESTDGHRFARFPTPKVCNGPLDGSVTVPRFKIPAPVVRVIITVDGDQLEVFLLDKKGEEVSLILNPVGGKFPDLDTLMPTGTPDRMLQVNINPRFLSEVIKAMRLGDWHAVRIHSTGAEGSVYRIEIPRFPELSYYVMPAGRRGYDE